MKKTILTLASLGLIGAVAYLGLTRGPGIYRRYQELQRLDEKQKTVETLIQKLDTLVNKEAPAEATPPAPIDLTRMGLSLPPGFTISIFAQGLGRPRDLELGPNGMLHVSDPSSGKIFTLPDRDGNGTADEIATVIEGLNIPHGIATHCSSDGKCKLYVADTDHVTSYDYDLKTLKGINEKELIHLQTGGAHVTRSILFLPPPNHNQILISVGSSCNVCNEQDWQRAKILVADADGQNFREYAKGLRNSVFMAVDPRDQSVWATDMGRDLLGDNLPPDELNVIEDGKNYGWPNCYGQNVHDTAFDKNTYIRNPCMEPFETPSQVDLPAHSAPLGLAFFPPNGWPSEYKNDLLVAYHGSWNRSVPTGYKVVRLKRDDQGKVLGIVDFITGWLKSNGTATGRPVDLLFDHDALYLSDDKAGAIYKITYSAPN